MLVTSLALQTLFYIVTVDGAKIYDVNEEAVKLYGYDLDFLLRKFRRTSDYANILQDEFDVFETRLLDNTFEIKNVLISESNLEARVKKALKEKSESTGVTIQLNDNSTSGQPTEDTKTTAETSTTTEAPADTPASNALRWLRFRFTNSTEDSVKLNLSRKANDNKCKKKEPTDVELLDDFIIRMKLSLKERIRMCNLGYEIAGEYIDKLINSMGSNRHRKGQMSAANEELHGDHLDGNIDVEADPERDDLDAFVENWSEVAQDRQMWKDLDEAFAQQWDLVGQKRNQVTESTTAASSAPGNDTKPAQREMLLANNRKFAYMRFMRTTRQWTD